MNETLQQEMMAWFALRDMDATEIARKYALDLDLAEKDANYGSLRGLTVLNPPEVPGLIFTDGDKVEVIYLRGFPTAMAADVESAIRSNGSAGEAAELRSRSGKRSAVLVYPGAGVAYSTNRTTSTVDFIEIFAPTTLEQYEARIYDGPGKFTK